jgi:hypothetical protein
MLSISDMRPHRQRRKSQQWNSDALAATVSGAVGA